MNYVSSRNLSRVFSLVILSVGAAQGTQTAILDGGSNLMLKSRDMQFAMGISQTSVGAKALAEQADQRSKNAEIISLSKQLSLDYAKIRGDLQVITTHMQVTLPDEIPATELSALMSLQNARANKFDRSYLKACVKQAERNISSCKAEIKNGRDEALRKFAIETLPVLEGHLERARSLYRALEKKT